MHNFSGDIAVNSGAGHGTSKKAAEYTYRMSIVTLIVSDGRDIRRYRLHYRTLILMLSEWKSFLMHLAAIIQEYIPIAPYDGGIVVVDILQKKILMLQSTFEMHNIDSSNLNEHGWQVLDYFFGRDVRCGIRDFISEINRCGIPAEAPWEWKKFGELHIT